MDRRFEKWGDKTIREKSYKRETEMSFWTLRNTDVEQLSEYKESMACG